MLPRSDQLRGPLWLWVLLSDWPRSERCEGGRRDGAALGRTHFTDRRNKFRRSASSPRARAGGRAGPTRPPPSDRSAPALPGRRSPAVLGTSGRATCPRATRRWSMSATYASAAWSADRPVCQVPRLARSSFHAPRECASLGPGRAAPPAHARDRNALKCRAERRVRAQPVRHVVLQH